VTPRVTDIGPVTTPRVTPQVTTPQVTRG
jgi:hypothetical protein